MREQRKSHNQALIRDCFEHFYQLYGAVRISGELCARKTPLSRTTAAKYMSQLGIKSRLRRKYRIAITAPNHTNPIAENLLDRVLVQQNRRHAALRNLTIDEFYEKLNTKNNSTNFLNLLCG